MCSHRDSDWRPIKMKRSLVLLLVISMLVSIEVACQDNVLSVLKSDLQLGDTYFKHKEFHSALRLYTNVERKEPLSKEINLKIGRCNYFLKQYSSAISAFDKHMKAGHALSLTDLYYYAEANAGIANYDKAIAYYEQYLTKVPDDPLVTKKIWQLKNKRFLYEDSLHFSVRPLAVNTDYGELCAVPYRDGLVFMSNRKKSQSIEKKDASLNTPFYKIYFSQIFPDSSGSGLLQYSKPTIFNMKFNSKFHIGPVTFYDLERKMAFVSTGTESGEEGQKTLQLFFAERKEDVWKVSSSFPYNSHNYSISDPTVSEDGTTIVFSSDMKGGFGGRDLYKSEYVNNHWTKPVNLGEQINTAYDEVFPYLHKSNTLYFSSNGHPGLGGLDIFKADIIMDGIGEPQNAGYPLNTNNDEFGFVIDSLSTHGYFTSNRKHGGYNDDIYEFDMDLQTYPLEISGLIRYKEHNWSDSSSLKIMPGVKLTLIDIIRNISVHESESDADGNFSITIPYYSKYKIKVVEEEDENFVSLEIPKHKKTHSKHEIVVVKDAFKTPENQVLK